MFSPTAWFCKFSFSTWAALNCQVRQFFQSPTALSLLPLPSFSILLGLKPFDFSDSCGFVHFSANISMAKKQTLPTFLLLYGCMIFLSQATALYRSRFELWQVFVLMLLLHSSARRLFDCPHCQPTHFYWQGELMKNPCQTSKHWDVKHSSWTIIILK